MVLQVDVLHVAVGPEHDPHHHLVAHRERPLHGLQHRALRRVLPRVERLGELQRRALVGRHLAMSSRYCQWTLPQATPLSAFFTVIWPISGLISPRRNRCS